ncbi:MAG: YggT family protein [Proteobacteria bacterium]|nr:YggT family protein [Pseudomonadota bacterium]
MSAPLISIVSFIVELVLNLIYVLVITGVIISWVGADPRNALVQTIKKLTDPLFAPFRGLNEKLNLPIDVAPLIVLLILTTIQKGILPALKMAIIQP